MSAEPHAEHAESPPSLYLTVWMTLVLLTGATVGVTFLDMKNFAVFTALLIATVKAGLVLLYFMHLRHGSKGILAIVGVTMALMAIFLSLTFVDVLYLYP